MGIVRMGPPTDLILLLRDELGITLFVETGTYRGDTAAWAASHFDRVVTFELSQSLHNQAVATYGLLPNVEFQQADSRRGLRELVSSLDEPALFWLDSHWSGGETYGSGDECPLLDEISVITTSPHGHVILIDDARLFESAPPRPHDPEQWPSIDQVIESLLSVDPRPAITIVEDVIVAVPPQARSLTLAYSQDVNTRSWERIGTNSIARGRPSLGLPLSVFKKMRRLFTSARSRTTS